MMKTTLIIICSLYWFAKRMQSKLYRKPIRINQLHNNIVPTNQIADDFV